MSFYVNALYSLSIGLATGAAWLRWRHLPLTYLPFLALIWAAFFTELLSINFILNHRSNVPLVNGYLLAQSLLLNAQFHRLRLFASRWLYPTLQGSFAAWWVAEMLWRADPYDVVSFFLMGSSFAIVLMSLTLMARLLFAESAARLRRTTFFLCCGFAVYYTYAVLTEACLAFRISQAVLTRLHIYQVLIYINLITNLFYLMAVVWMPPRTRSLR